MTESFILFVPYPNYCGDVDVKRLYAVWSAAANEATSASACLRLALEVKLRTPRLLWLAGLRSAAGTLARRRSPRRLFLLRGNLRGDTAAMHRPSAGAAESGSEFRYQCPLSSGGSSFRHGLRCGPHTGDTRLETTRARTEERQPRQPLRRGDCIRRHVPGAERSILPDG